MPIQEKCTILAHQKVGPTYYKLTLSSSYISTHAEPGQFVNVRCGETYVPLLRRPFSLHRVSKEEKTFEILYEVVGKGTELLSQYKTGSDLDVLGPLGSGFKIDEKKQIAILVAGGIGVAPLLMLAEEFRSLVVSRKSLVVYVLIGAKNRDLILCEEDFKKVTDQILVSTDDGSCGQKGLISDILLDFINNQLSVVSCQLSVIYACGPKEMLKAIAEIAFQKKIDCQVSIEERMACGIGACLGCAAKTKSGHKMVCKDGPVFEVEEILW